MTLVLRRSGIFFLLALALLPRLAQAQRIGPLVQDNPQQLKSSTAERGEETLPPSLRLSLPSPAELALPPLGPDDLQRLQPQHGRPPVIGVHRRLPQGALKLSFSGGGVKSTAEGAWQSTEAGRLWRLKLTSPSASAMRVHFRDFALGSGRLWLHSEDGQAVGPYSGTGQYGDGDFWSGIVFGDSLTIEYLPEPAAAGEAVPFRIVAISHIWGDAFGDDMAGGVRQPESAWGRSDRSGAAKLLPGRIDPAVGTPSKKAWLAQAIQSVKRSASLQPLSPKAARPLTPGRPVTFSRGPVDSPTLFHGDYSYQLEVPEDAASVTFTLKSDADVALLVRYGEDNEVRNRMAVYDYYADEVFAGTEKLVITPQSKPPLQAGTYFVSVAVFATDVEVNCMLTAEVEIKDLPQISGGTLTPGQPAPFRLGPVDTPTIFYGSYSFRLEVPADASCVTFTLESDDDVALYVRYGEDSIHQDGNLLYDYSDRNRTGNERIVITPRSDPPLQAGTYFASITVWDTGVVAEGTLTAEIELEGESRPMISGGTLTPGQPAPFRLGPVDTPTIFYGSYSFRLDAPDNATRITFTLESIDPDVDVALYVRYGENIVHQDGNLLYDYSDRNRTGNERIVITPRSDPPLQAGTYFASITVWDTGVVAEGTLTAEIELEGESRPMISGGPLTPGQPAPFRLGPVDSPTIFYRNRSFRLDAPDNATRITFTLESVDPDVDVALYVRYGENIVHQDGKLLYDYRDRNSEGNERIGITRRSDPPLRAGTYFASITVWDTGVVAEGTLTATVETDTADCHLDVTCYPEWSRSATGVATIFFETSEGGSSRCSGTLLNNRRQDLTPYFLTAAHCVATEEEARSVTAFWLYQTRTCSGDPPDLRSVPQTEGALLLATTGFREVRDPEGDMTLLQIVDDLPGGIWFQGWDAAPQPIGTQVTGIHHPGSDWGRFKRISFGQIIPGLGSGTSDEIYAIISYPVGQGYTQKGSSGSAAFSSLGIVVGALSFGPKNDDDCPTEPVVNGYTNFSVFYPHIRPFIDSTLPEIAGGALPPGRPAAFRLGPVDSPMLFSGDSTFQVEVPEGVTRVTFTLESVDPDVNVDLYVRYGEDNAIQGRRVVSDYSSTGPTGNEQIVVTPQSDPPLRAGTYYVSMMLRTTRAVAEVTLTAEFDSTAPPPAGDQIYYFPHLAVGAGWQTTLTYINYSSEEVSCRTDFLSDQVTPLMVSFPSLGPVVRRSDVLPPGGSVHEETDVGLSAPAAAGWARATCSGPVKASLLFRQYDSAGVAVAEAGVNAAAVPATRFVTFAEQAAGLAGTGVAYANPSDTAAVVTFTAKDEEGRTLDSFDQTLMPGEHGAKNMAGLFDLPSFTGSLEITSTEPIVTLSINAEAAPIFSSLPPGELDPSAQGATTYYFPHLAVGASWQTTITYINYSSEEVSCRTDFLSSQGTPLTVSFPGLGPVIRRRDVLPPGGSVHEETDVGLSAPAAAGWARAACTGPVKASLLFRQYDSAGAPTGEAGVNAAAAAATRFVSFAEQAAGQAGTGVAYANPSGTATTVVTFTARDEAGRTLDSEDQELMPGEHGAQNMAGLFGLPSFTGSLEISSSEPIVTLSLNAEAAPVFSSLPPGELDESTP